MKTSSSIWLFAFLLAVSVTAAEQHKLQTSDPAIAKQILEKGGRLVADYGSYQLFETTLPLPSVENRDDYNRILLHAGAIDTRTARRQPHGGFAGKRMQLVQLAGPVQPAWREQLEATGACIVSYIPHNTYLVYGDTDALARLGELAGKATHIQWNSAYLDAHKIHPRTAGAEHFAIQLVADADANPATLQLIEKLKLAPIQRQSKQLGYHNVIVSLPPAAVAQLAAQPDVVSIQPYFPRKKFCERQDQIIAGNLTGSVPSGPGYLGWLAGKGFTQAQFDLSGFAVDVSDSGIDDGSTTPNHFGLYTGGDTGATSRVIYNRLEGSANAGSTLKGCDGHGNLNSHIIAGFNNLSGFPHTDTNGYHYGLGVCPFVKVGSSVIFDPKTFTNPDYTDLSSRAYNNGARISNNSWGADTAGAYDIDAQQYDALVRDAQPDGAPYPATGNQPMVFVFASGNAGPGTQTVGSPGTAKNVITVGAAENVQAFGGADGSNVTDAQADNANDIISFSSRGPCSDGRKKPEIVAPGSHVSGGVPQAVNPSSTGTADSCYDGTGVSGGTGGSHYWPNTGQQFYTASSGTSHATPCVAGACALLRQYFINLNHFPPSPAMTKAFLMNSARYLTGTNANDTLWSNNQGMGELNLGTAFDGTSRFLRDQVAADLFTASGQTHIFTGTVTDSNKPFRVTLTWTDAPGSTSGNAYNNNLDLTVAIAGKLYKGNVFSGALSTTGGVADVANNAESVFLSAGVSGTYTVTVTAVNINSDAVPHNVTGLDQDFALVIYNGTAPSIIADTATLLGESFVPTNNAADPGETVTFNLGLQNIGNAPVSNLVATLLATNGVTYPSAPQTYGLLNGNDPTVARPFTFIASGNCGDIITATLQLQDGPTNLGTATFNFRLGQLIPSIIFTQNFDGVTAPALPAGWTTTHTGSQTDWKSATTSNDTPPNAAFSSDPRRAGVNELVSPAFTVQTANAQLTFRNYYNTESGWDGGVLEIKIGTNAFTDIQTAGGNFTSGGYNATLGSGSSNPLAGRQAWSGNSGGFITTTVNLPASAVGQTIQLKWRCGSDSNTSGAGWYIDTIVVTDYQSLCCVNTDLALTSTNWPNPVAAGYHLSCALAVTNQGPFTATNVTLTNTLPTFASLLTVTTSQGTYTNTGTHLIASLGSLAPNAAATIQLLAAVTNTATGVITNITTVAATQGDPLPADNTVTNLVTILADSDQDGIPDVWMNFYFGQPTGSATADPDGDGMTNLQEYLAGTSPIDSLNVLRITNAAATGNDFAVTFPTVTGKLYAVERNPDLTNAAGWSVLQTDISGTGAPVTVTDPGAAGQPRYFYRVRLLPPK